MTGLAVLNVGAGDTKLSFDKDKPEERKRAAAAVGDMLKRGFAILVEVGRDEKGPLYRRCESFDPETCEYIIVGAPSDDPAAVKPKATRKRFAADKTPAVSVSRSAGG